MDDDKVLDHLLKIEAEASALVNDAQAEADRRVADAEKRNRAAYDERYRAEAEHLEADFQQSKDAVKTQYQKELDAYREQLGSLGAGTAGFSALLERYIAEDLHG